MPGQPYEASGFEIWAPVAPLYHAGKYAEAADRFREIVEAHPEYPQTFYNLACCESLAGRPADAVGHLRQAIEQSGGRSDLREWARGDTDFDAIRELPEFQELVGG